jgi:hypothetical protein
MLLTTPDGILQDPVDLNESAFEREVEKIKSSSSTLSPFSTNMDNTDGLKQSDYSPVPLTPTLTEVSEKSLSVSAYSSSNAHTLNPNATKSTQNTKNSLSKSETLNEHEKYPKRVEIFGNNVMPQPALRYALLLIPSLS